MSRLHMWIVGGVFLLLLLVFLLVRGRDFDILEGREGEKILAFNHLNITGYENGKKHWHIEADEGWVAKGEVQNHFYGVRAGEVYRNGKPIVKDLVAPYVLRERYSKVLSASIFDPEKRRFRDPKKFLTARLDLHAVTEEAGKPAWYALKAKSLSYNENQALTTMAGNVDLRGRKVRLNAEEVQINHKDRTAKATQKVRLYGERFILRGGTVTGKFPDGIFEITDYPLITLTSDRQKPSTVRAAHIIYDEDGRDPIRFDGRVLVRDENKRVESHSATFDTRKHLLELIGGVNADFPKDQGKKLLRKETAQKLKNPETQETIREHTRLLCDRFTINTKTHDAAGFGNVRVTQKGKSARSDEVKYFHQKDILQLRGNVEIQKENDWLKTKFVDVSISDETFMAGDEVEAKFQLKVED